MRFFFSLMCGVMLAGICCSCGKSPAAGTKGKSGKAVVRKAYAGIPPICYLASRIYGEVVPSVLPDGQNPRDYTPTPADVRQTAKARVFLYTGMPFEKKFLAGLKNSSVQIVDVTAGIKRIPMDAHHGHDDGDRGHKAEAADHHHAGELDPHVWLDPANCRIIAKNILDKLISLLPDRKNTFTANYLELIRDLDAMDAENRKRLAPFKGRAFLVHHAAFGYFAKAYGLEQLSIELGGREPSPSQLAKVIRVAREHRVSCIFVQPQFNPASANALSKAIGGYVESLDPLEGNVVRSLHFIGYSVARGFETK